MRHAPDGAEAYCRGTAARISRRTLPIAHAGAAQTIADPARVAVLSGTASDDGLPAGSALTTGWSQVAGPVLASIGLPGALTTWVQFGAPGTYVFRLTATDGSKSSTSDVTITLEPPAGGLPSVSFASPADGAKITKPTPLTGSVSGGAWSVDLALGDLETIADGSWRTIGSGNGPVVAGALATLDPTVLLNGAYTLRLRSSTSAGSAEATLSVVVEKSMKVGTFALAFDDLSVPQAGFPLQVQRTYESRDKSVGDFGVGWRLGAKSARVEKSTSLGKSWYQTKDASNLLPIYTLIPSRPTYVTVTFPTGKVYKFQMQASPTSQTLYPYDAVDVVFDAVEGTVGSLYATDGSALTVEVGAYGIPGPVTLQTLSLETFNPTRFTLTDEDGITYVIGQTTGIEKITDLDGNWLSIGPSGLVHSSGRAVSFTRDPQGRITQITDPAGQVMHYTYDALGNLASFTNRASETQTYAYDGQHDLTAITDGRGVTPANYAYDPAGRLVGVTDASGNPTSFVHDVDQRRETVTDALGHTTIYEYDDAGNVLKKTDAAGKITSYSYSADDDKLSETDALGRTKHWTYDVFHNVLSESDALAHATTYTFGINRKLKTRTDALGRTTTETWDYDYAHRQRHTEPTGAYTQYAYNARGQLYTTTDARGGVTTYVYNVDGTVDAELDALGHGTSYGYDASGNRTRETRTRTLAGGVTQTLTTTWTYDAQGRVTKTTYPDGSSTSTAYNKIGKPIETSDALGRVTKYEYDSLGRQIKVTHPDATYETTSYDALGRKASSTDRAGRTTTYGYDAVGRLVATTYPDLTTRTSVYDDAGQLVETRDELGHATFYGYDAAGRRTTVTDALGNVTTMAYDVAGQLATVTDPLGHATTYAYDLAGRQTRVTYADGAHDDTGYDAAGNRTAKTDQAGVATAYAYDLLGRLSSVTDAMGHVTSYGYDEVGEKVAQTDANLHTTRYGYDSAGRRVTRTLPMGQVEQTVYDVAGRVVSKTDFNGKVTTFGYDTADRLVLRTADASFGEVPVSWTYSVTGRRLSMTDATGVTTYAYDARDRLVSKATPEGTLSYTRDLSGHVATVRSEKSEGVAVDYSWDEDGRLSTVTDRGPGSGSSGLVTTYGYDTAGRMLGWVQPNGVKTSFTYDTVNHLTADTITNAASTVLASYTYTLSATGNRTGVTEASGRAITWGYDNLYRLTGETISGSASANGAVGYAYDSVGNRLSRTSTVPGIAASTSTYDANDRVSGESFDANGDQLTREGKTQSFDSQDRLVSSAPTSGASVHVYYDGDGNRVAVDVGGALVSYLVDDQNPTGYSQVVEERASGSVQRAYVFGRKAISKRDLNAGAWIQSYYEQDGHGSVVALTDAGGVVTDTWEYDAFGTVIGRTGATPNSLTYSGEWWDEAQGLQYLRARWYSPGAGRFVSGDTFEGGGERPASANRYAYGDGNPIGRVDPSGHEASSIVEVLAPILDLFGLGSAPGVGARWGGWSSPVVLSFTASHGAEPAGNPNLHVDFALTIAGSEYDVRVGQELWGSGISLGKTEADTDTTVFNGEDNHGRPERGWWTGNYGEDWKAGARDGVNPRWRGGFGFRFVDFWDAPGPLGKVYPGTLYQFHMIARTYVENSHSGQRLREIWWRGTIDIDPLTNVATKSWSLLKKD